ncbi:hypothetical protein C2845_PM03G00330 [Panicum miliaceum]|uniref:Uncharacterized protein n=1 Tax=Panicum miliaceum TaxID=4540 RepID=A0A3L6TG08_PANMI|nr:hypothetical protein C2845_PM03G00330 [Panicum miliaceum]
MAKNLKTLYHLNNTFDSFIPPTIAAPPNLPLPALASGARRVHERDAMMGLRSIQ